MEKRSTAILNPSMFYLGLKHVKNLCYLFNILNYKMNPVPRSGKIIWSHITKGLSSSPHLEMSGSLRNLVEIP